MAFPRIVRTVPFFCPLGHSSGRYVFSASISTDLVFLGNIETPVSRHPHSRECQGTSKANVAEDSYHFLVLLLFFLLF